MPTATHIASLIERCSFLQFAGCCEASEFGSASVASSLGSESSIGLVRFTSQHTLPRHSTSIFWPGSILLMSTSIGARAAFARAEGQNDMTNGTTATALPTPPMTLVAIRRRRRDLSTALFSVASAILSIPRSAETEGASRERSAVSGARSQKTRGLYGICPTEVQNCPNFAVESGSCKGDRLLLQIGFRTVERRCPLYFRHASQILAVLRAGLHAVRGCALRGLHAAARPAAAPHRPRRQRHRHAGEHDARRFGESFFLCGRREKSHARRGQHLHQQGRALAQSARRRSHLPPLLSRSAPADAAAPAE